MEDNTGLLRALEESEEVLTCFFLDPRQLQSNPYRSDFAVKFMFESLEDLAGQIERKGGRLNILRGEAEEMVAKIVKDEGVEAVFVNRGYTPFSKKRDEAILRVAPEFFRLPDALLNEPEVVLKGDGDPYTVFTPYWKKAREVAVREPRKCNFGNFCDRDLGSVELVAPEVGEHPEILLGGREEALKLLGKLADFKNYSEERDIPALKKTTHLSPHHKFGTVSIREVYHRVAETLGPSSGILQELYWRDFFTQIAWHFLHVFGKSFKPKYDKVPWPGKKEHFEAWKEGKTGFAIVDAGMRELNTTGFMHNRVRMITASFLVKDLHVDWREGERYFASKLVDYDPAVNNGNWQWAASTGCDAQPYFRIFNPERQEERFDPEREYIKKWLGEEDLEREPIVDHKAESRWAKELYKNNL